MSNSRQKGKRGERAWRDELRGAGFLKSRRGQQYAGGADSPDVICPEMPNVHFEVKYTEKLRIYDAMFQAKRDAGYKMPVVAFRSNNNSWLTIIPAEHFFTLVKDAGYATPASCPACEDTKIVKCGKEV